jgi:hypothetical protein
VKLFAFIDGNHGTDGVKYMDAGEYIGSSINGINGCQHINKDIAPSQGIQIHPQIVSVRPYGVDNQADCHAGEEEGTNFIKILL